ncbi:uncharacterized protein (DUF779 family) [Rhizobium mongolense]|uniref:Uncharacterized protein (DUF779 family) n=1 Tax=Rhizobium mongolense TaxID=57676 RepID=A0A7W6RUX2_9HYPH|nr:uncharacterized protein (DUF779 family) [Rhizobium mongolense]
MKEPAWNRPFPVNRACLQRMRALVLISEIRRDHPDILFHQSGGCCDGSSPMCYPSNESGSGRQM